MAESLNLSPASSPPSPTSLFHQETHWPPELFSEPLVRPFLVLNCSRQFPNYILFQCLKYRHTLTYHNLKFKLCPLKRGKLKYCFEPLHVGFPPLLPLPPSIEMDQDQLMELFRKSCHHWRFRWQPHKTGPSFFQSFFRAEKLFLVGTLHSNNWAGTLAEATIAKIESVIFKNEMLLHLATWSGELQSISA